MLEFTLLKELYHIDSEGGIHYHLADSETEILKPHRHEFYETVIALDDLKHYINGKMFLEKRGTVLLVKPDDCHLFYSEPKFKIHNIAFSVTVKNNLCGFLGERALKLFEQNETPRYILSNRELAALDARIKRINSLDFYNVKDKNYNFRVVIMDIITKYFTANERNGYEDMPLWLRKFDEKMRYQENFSKKSDIMVSVSGKSREHISRSIKKYFGVTASAYINDIRLNYAANLLINSNLPIIDISMECGFDNLSWFYRLFENKFGKTPKKFRG